MSVKRVTAFDRQTAKMVANIAERAVADALKPFGLVVMAKGGTFEGGSFTMKIEAATVGADGLVATREAEDFKALAKFYGFEEGDLGLTFDDQGHAWKVIGLKPKAGKFPVIVEREDGRRFKFPAERVLRRLGRTVPAHLEAIR